MLQTALPTGIEIIDERLYGGILPGSIVVFTAEPTSESERFLSQLTRPRPTHYLTTQRSKAAVRTALEEAEVDLANCRLYEVDPENPLDHAARIVQDISEETTLVIDSMNPLEAVDDHHLWSFLNLMGTRMADTGGVAILHCIDGRRVPDGRDTTEYMADVIFRLETETYGDTIQNRLFVPKVRRGQSLKQAIKLDLTRGVTVDTSRDLS